MIDFTKRLNKKKSEKKLNPVDIYETIDRKSDTGPLRPAQKEILESWFNNRKSEKDLIVKLHTGEGKTLIGLLILQSVLNSNEGPCLYVCPNIYLVKQVCVEAKKFGIGYCTIGDDGIPNEFVSGEKILIVHAQKLFNGLSVFGINNDFVKASTIILDDSHACIDVIKDALSITIKKKSNPPLYDNIISIFEDDLKDQGEGSFLDIENGNYNTLMTIPYWSWFDKKSEVLASLAKYTTIDNQIKFSWPLLRDSIEHYSCYITANKIEISPYYPNVSSFPTFSKAKHRILMSATTQDDSFFIKGLNFNPKAVQEPLIDTQQKWSGEKMIVIPSLIKENLDRDLIVTKFSRANFTDYGVVALIPSTKKAEQYQAGGATIASPSTIFDEIDKIKNKEFGKMLVINNRYDGIDLPDESCRVLIMDSIPYFDSLSDRYEEISRPSSEIINKRIAQKIEQGLGRGVRGEKDYCFVLLIGSDLVKFVRSIDSKKYFSPQTKKQIEIGLSIAKMAKEDEDDDNGDYFNIIKSLLNQSTSRNEGWKQYYFNEMNSIDSSISIPSLYEKLELERDIEQQFIANDYSKACNNLQNYIDEKCDDPLEKGWYQQQLARFYYKSDRVKSNKLQLSAFKANNQLLKPKSGISYKRISYIDQNRLGRIRDFLARYKSYEELQLSVDEMLDNLTFGVDSNKFEASLQMLGELLGFVSQRPDKYIRKGPDNLWCGVDNHYLMFECKNEVKSERAEISKSEANQMISHCEWFKSEYGDSTKVSCFLIISTKNLSYYATLPKKVKIIRKGKLRRLKGKIKDLLTNLLIYKLTEISDETLQNLLDDLGLNSSDFESEYSEPYYQETK